MFCRIYVTGNNLTENYLLQLLSKTLDEKIVDDAYIENNYINITVRSNTEYDKEEEKKFPDGFLYFKYFIEVDSGIDDSQTSQEVSKILRELWKKDIPAIASCSFEDQLPEMGGYNSLKVPWVK